MTKLLSARASLRTALQPAASTKFIAADNPDQVKVGKKAPKQNKQGKVAHALLAQTGSF